MYLLFMSIHIAYLAKLIEIWSHLNSMCRVLSMRMCGCRPRRPPVLEPGWQRGVPHPLPAQPCSPGPRAHQGGHLPAARPSQLHRGVALGHWPSERAWRPPCACA